MAVILNVDTAHERGARRGGTVLSAAGRLLQCRARKAAGILVAALAFLTWQHPASANEAPVDGGTLTFVVQPEPPTLLPQVNSTTNVQLVGTKIFESLFGLDERQAVKPALALSYQVSADGREIKLQLRKGVKWHDGPEFTSEDVKYTLEEVIKKYHPRGRSVLAKLEAVETPAPDVAVLRFSEPSLYVISALVGPEMPMLGKHTYGGGDPRQGQANQKPIGTGPFRFVEWKKGSHITFEKNPDYWAKGKPHIDKLLVRFIPDSSARAIAFESGEVDIAGSNPIPLHDVERFRGSKTVEVVTKGYDALAGIMYFEFNLRNPKFADRRVRQAIAHAINSKFIAENVWFGFGEPASTVVPKTATTFFDPALQPYAYDKAAAEKLLDEAGLKRGAGGVRLKITHDAVPLDQHFQRLGAYIKQALGEVGIEVELRNQDFPTWLRRVYTDNDFDTTSYNIFGMSDPTIGVQRIFWGPNIVKGVGFSNGSGYRNPEVDKLLEAAQVAPTQEERVRHWRQIQKILATDLPVIPLINVKYTTVLNKRVRNFDADGFGVYGSFADLYLKP